MQYYLILLFQGYCIYHMYKNRNPYYWAFLIMFLPIIGCIIYLITQVYNKRDAEKITSEIYQNRVNLADAFLEIKDYKHAISHYLEAIEGNYQNDLYIFQNLIECYFRVEDYDNVVLYADKIKTHSEFKKSRSQFLYGLALEKTGNLDEAEANLKAIDIRYSFYNERLVYAKFLLSRNKTKEGKEVLEEIYAESQHMTKQNKRLFKATTQDVEKLLKEIN